MRKNPRRPDARKYGPSELVKFDPTENYHARHERRKEVNLENKQVLENWCNVVGWSFEIKNEGHHWIFQKAFVSKSSTGFSAETFLVEWWPSSAKLVVNKQWDKGVHIHDYLQVRNFLRKIEAERRLNK